MAYLRRKQRKNTWLMLLGAIRYCKHHGFSRRQARQHLRYCLMCCKVESNLWIWANINVEDSFNFQHDFIGSDHLSVGMFQQQVPSWGPTGVCMSPAGGAHLFLRRNTKLGQDALDTSPSAWEFGTRVQNVQVSAFPDRYAEWYDWSWRYLHYNFRFRRLLRAVHYPKDKR